MRAATVAKQASITQLARGVNIPAVWERACHLRAAFADEDITKRTAMTVRVGVDFEKKQETIDRREATGALPQPPNGFEWVKWPFTLRAIKSRKLYVRMEAGTLDLPRKTTFFHNGEEVELEEISSMLLARELGGGGSPTFNVAVNDLIRLGDAAV